MAMGSFLGAETISMYIFASAFPAGRAGKRRRAAKSTQNPRMNGA
jgi:hypothetical protein